LAVAPALYRPFIAVDYLTALSATEENHENDMVPDATANIPTGHF
jgi:hypothetical protein